MNMDILNSLQVKVPVEINNPPWCSCTQSKVIQYEVVWIVHKHDYDDLDVGEVFKSSVFSLGNHRAWIDMYPRGDPDSDGFFESDESPVSLYLQFEHGKSPNLGKVSFQVSSRKAEKMINNDSHTAALGWGFHRIWKEDDTELELKIINCIIAIVVPPPSPDQINIEAQTNDLLKLAGDFGSLLNSEKFSDVTIKIGEHELRAHKNILSSRSDVFAAMFQVEMTEKRSNVIDISDVDVDVMRHLLKYIYSGKFDKIGESVESLMVAADKYGLEELKMRCSKILIQKISIFNVANLLILADRYQDSDLVRETFNFIKKNWAQVQESDAWKDLKKARGDLAFFVQSVLKE